MDGDDDVDTIEFIGISGSDDETIKHRRTKISSRLILAKFDPIFYLIELNVYYMKLIEQKFDKHLVMIEEKIDQPNNE